MHQGAFADCVVHELTGDLSLLDSLVGMVWSRDNNLLVRIQPINPEAWREIGELVVERLRDLAQRVKFKAKLQQVNVNGVRNLVFSITPAEQSGKKSKQINTNTN